MLSILQILTPVSSLLVLNMLRMTILIPYLNNRTTKVTPIIINDMECIINPAIIHSLNIDKDNEYVKEIARVIIELTIIGDFILR